MPLNTRTFGLPVSAPEIIPVSMCYASKQYIGISGANVIDSGSRLILPGASYYETRLSFGTTPRVVYDGQQRPGSLKIWRSKSKEK